MLTVACVYKSGGDYDIVYVERLLNGLRKNLKKPCRIICLSDIIRRPVQSRDNSICGFIPLMHYWPGWWAKIELFRLQPPVLYFDLDTIITGDITPLAEWVEHECEGLMMLRGFYKGDRCSGIMGWRHGMYTLYTQFKSIKQPNFIKTPRGYNMRTAGRSYRGDQEWIASMLAYRTPVTFAQDIFPGIKSYKVDIMPTGKVNDAKIVCFHGKPRPHEIDLEVLQCS